RFERAPGPVTAGVQRLDQHARRDLPGDAPAILAPAARAFLAAVVDDGVPVAIGFFLRVGRDLEGKGFGLLECWATVQAEARNARHGEFNGQFVALLAAGEVRRRVVDGGHRAVGKRRGIEARGRERILLEPEADRVLRFHFFRYSGLLRSSRSTSPCVQWSRMTRSM